MAIPNSFGTYLEAKDLRRSPAERTEPSSAWSSAQAQDPATFARALELLVKGDFPSPVPALLEQSGMSIDEFTSALDRLSRAGLIALSNEDNRQLATLTERGQALRSS